MVTHNLLPLVLSIQGKGGKTLRVTCRPHVESLGINGIYISPAHDQYFMFTLYLQVCESVVSSLGGRVYPRAYLRASYA